MWDTGTAEHAPIELELECVAIVVERMMSPENFRFSGENTYHREQNLVGREEKVIKQLKEV